MVGRDIVPLAALLVQPEPPPALLPEVSALRWADVADAGDADGILVTGRRSKTNQVGETSDVRYLKNGAGPAPEGRPECLDRDAWGGTGLA